jgi:5-methylcytosine-specific restriction protein B
MTNKSTWFVSAYSENGDDLTNYFVKEKIWKIQDSKKYGNIINSIQIGDQIAIKSTKNQKSNFPFNTHGKIMSVMIIKAIGIVTENKNNEKELSVQWTKSNLSKKWYFLTFIRKITKVESNPKDWMHRDLLDFTFKDRPQDINRFLNDPNWKKKLTQKNNPSYKNEIIMALKKFEGEAYLFEIQEEIKSRGKLIDIHKNPDWQAKVRFTLQQLSSDSKSYVHGEDVFYRKSFSNELWGLRNTNQLALKIENYSQHNFLSETTIDVKKYNEIAQFLKHNKSIIIKNYPTLNRRVCIKNFVYSLIGKKDSDQILSIQMENYVHTTQLKNSNDSILMDSNFLDFCEKALQNSEKDYYFIIDNINYKNITKILFDLMYLFKRKSYSNINNLYRLNHNYLMNNIFVIALLDQENVNYSDIDTQFKKRFPIIEINEQDSFINLMTSNHKKCLNLYDTRATNSH